MTAAFATAYQRSMKFEFPASRESAPGRTGGDDRNRRTNDRESAGGPDSS
jgi:hypothetical protein